MRANFFLSLLVTAGAFTLNDATLAEIAPDTPKKPVASEYQGVTVEDPYQWLEADDDSQVKAWSDAQNQRTRKNLDSFPDRTSIEKQLQDWYAKTSPSYSSLVSRPGILFAMKFQPPKQQPLLVTLASADDLKSEKVVLDPNVLDTKGTTAIDWFVTVVGRQIRRHVTFQRWQRRRNTSLLRNCDGQSVTGFDCACPISHGRRQRGLERGWLGHLLHAFSQER